jgi:hypothetical protein
LEQTPGYVKRSVPFDSNVDKDHDYASYYDFEFDEMIQEETDYDCEGEEITDDNGDNVTASNSTPKPRGREYVPASVLDLHPDLAEIFEVKCSWTGEGDPPLASRLSDYFSYVKGNHLSPRAALPVTLLPACDYGASEILHYYVLRPYNHSISNVPDINPTNVKMLWLSYSNPLVMQLIIAQRVNHREVSSAILPTGERADRFLAKAIGDFGPKIDSYLAGKEEEMLPLTLGSIIVSLVDVGFPFPSYSSFSSSSSPSSPT